MATTPNPKDLVKAVDVAITLKADKGRDVSLKSFEVVDFTTKGDNYACVVTSVVVRYERVRTSGNAAKDAPSPEQTVTYVVKLNPCRPGMMGEMMPFIFNSEIEFYSVLLPLLDRELQASGDSSHRLRVPRYFHSVSTKGAEAIYFEDLRKGGYKMHDRVKTMNEAHVLLILKELARLHAASARLFNKDGLTTTEQVLGKYPVLTGNWEKMKKLMGDNDMLEMAMDSSASLLDNEASYAHVAQFLRSKKKTIGKEFGDALKPTSRFMTIRHGDCWNNNFLFRYSTSGVPQECRLLDLQMVSLGSVTLDLHHFLFPCMAAKERQATLPALLTTYYAHYASVLSGPPAGTLQQSVSNRSGSSNGAKVVVTGIPIRFSLPEFQQEFRDKLLFGIIMAISMVPMVLLKPEDTPNIADFFPEGGFTPENSEAMNAYKDRVNELTRQSSSFRPRLLDMFDELKEYGIFKNEKFSNLVRAFSTEK